MECYQHIMIHMMFCGFRVRRPDAAPDASTPNGRIHDAATAPDAARATQTRGAAQTKGTSTLSYSHPASRLCFRVEVNLEVSQHWRQLHCCCTLRIVIEYYHVCTGLSLPWRTYQRYWSMIDCEDDLITHWIDAFLMDQPVIELSSNL